jgi:hypothetical protein
MALGINGVRNESAHLTELPWAGFGMSITPYLDDFGVDPETKRVLGVALEMTRVALGVAERRDDVNEIIAKRIIALSKQGERNPDLLCERALTSLRGQYL